MFQDCTSKTIHINLNFVGIFNDMLNKPALHKATFVHSLEIMKQTIRSKHFVETVFSATGTNIFFYDHLSDKRLAILNTAL